MKQYRSLEEYNLEITDEVKSRYSSIITEIGEDLSRDGLVKTPERAAKAMLFLTQGYKQDAVSILKGAMFKESYDEMVIIKDIEVYSLCEHHMLPFFGKAHIVECLNNTLKPQGVAVVIEASHMCMMMRGVQKQNSVTTTSGFRGQFEKIETRNEFLKLISSKLS